MKNFFHILLIGVFIWSFYSDKKSKQLVLIKTEQENKSNSSFKKGKKLFVKNCASCHYIGMDKVATAPALGGITKKRNKEWLYRYTRNSFKMFNEGDSIAVDLRDQGWGLMTSFPSLSDNDLNDIYFFVEKQYEITKKKSN